MAHHPAPPPAVSGDESRDLAGFLVSLVAHVLLLLWLASMIGAPPAGRLPIVIESAVAAADPAEEGEFELMGEPPPQPDLPPVAAVAVPGGDDDVAPAVVELVVADVAAEATAAGPGIDVPDAAVLDAALGGNATGATAGRGKRGFYGLGVPAGRVVFVADRSDSMRGANFQRLKRELRYAIVNLPPKAMFSIVFFDHGAHPMAAKSLVPATSPHKHRHLAWADQIDVGGGTDPSTAMAIALALEPTTVFLCTDGAFDPRPTLEAIARGTQDRAVQIHTIGVGSGSLAAAPILRRIALENKGQFRYVAD